MLSEIGLTILVPVAALLQVIPQPVRFDLPPTIDRCAGVCSPIGVHGDRIQSMSGTTLVPSRPCRRKGMCFSCGPQTPLLRGPLSWRWLTMVGTTMLHKVAMAEQMFHAFDFMPQGICVLRQDLVVIFWNRCLEDWTHLHVAKWWEQAWTASFPISIAHNTSVVCRWFLLVAHRWYSRHSCIRPCCQHFCGWAYASAHTTVTALPVPRRQAITPCV